MAASYRGQQHDLQLSDSTKGRAHQLLWTPETEIAFLGRHLQVIAEAGDEIHDPFVYRLQRRLLADMQVVGPVVGRTGLAGARPTPASTGRWGRVALGSARFELQVAAIGQHYQHMEQGLWGLSPPVVIGATFPWLTGLDKRQQRRFVARSLSADHRPSKPDLSLKLRERRR
jgi:hypothetical protein